MNVQGIILFASSRTNEGLKPNMRVLCYHYQLTRDCTTLIKRVSSFVPLLPSLLHH